MTTYRPRVPEQTKLVLIEEVGRKCANPGCPNRLVELLHIREWHIYQSHDASHMIAICATCHDSVDRGALHISDDDLYEWKGVARTTPSATHLFVEPGKPPLLVLGSISARGDSGLIVFNFAERHRLSFAVQDGDIMLLNIKVSAFDKRPLLDVVEGYVRQRDNGIELNQRPGRIQIPASLHSPLVPEWARTSLLLEDVFYGIEGLNLLDLHVVEPGVVKVEGIWMDQDKGVVVTNDRMSFLHRERPRPITLRGAGKESVLHFTGPVGTTLFGV